MNKILLPLLLLFINVPVFSQCYLASDEIDDFTNQRKVMTSLQTVSSKKGSLTGQYQFCLVSDGKAFLLINQLYYSQSYRSLCFNQDSKISIKAESGEVYELPYVGNVECSSSSGNFYNLQGFFHIPNEILEELETDPVVKFRVQYAEGFLDNDFGIFKKAHIMDFKGDKKKSSTTFFMDNIPCIKETLTTAKN